MAGYDDSHGNIGELERYAAIQALLKEFPELSAKKTKAQLSEAVGRLTCIHGGQTETHQVHRSLTKDISDARNGLNETANEIVMIKLGGVYRGEEYGKEMAHLWTEVYRRGGIPRGIKLEAIIELRTLAKLQTIMDQIKTSLCKKVS